MELKLEMYTDKEVAKMFNLSTKWGHVTVQRMAIEGRLRGVKIGDRWRFSKASIEDFVNGNRRRS